MVKAMLLQRNINAFVFYCFSVCYVKMTNSGTIGQNKHCNNASPVGPACRPVASSCGQTFTGKEGTACQDVSKNVA